MCTYVLNCILESVMKNVGIIRTDITPEPRFKMRSYSVKEKEIESVVVEYKNGETTTISLKRLAKLLKDINK